tara:strand:+ start:306 stop:1001 length:696 start_codon:yes stop_codon:yes gene_type:complete
MQRAYVLRVRPFRDTQHLIQLLTEHDGCFTAIIRTASGKRQHTSRAALRLFQPIYITWQGQGQLKRIQHIEIGTREIPLQAERTIMAFYLNELCLRLLPQQAPITGLLDTYHHTLMHLASDADPQAYLRYFEAFLLQELGCLPSLIQDEKQEAIKHTTYYRIQPMQNWQVCHQDYGDSYIGEMLWQLHQHSLHPQHFQSARKLLRQFLQPLLGPKPLSSRRLFQHYKRNQT